MEVGDGPRTFGDDDDDVSNTDPMRRLGFYTRRHPEKTKSRAIEQTTHDGVPVTLEPLQEPMMRESASQSSGSLPGRHSSPNVALVTTIFDGSGMRRGIGRGAFARRTADTLCDESELFNGLG